MDRSSQSETVKAAAHAPAQAARADAARRASLFEVMNAANVYVERKGQIEGGL